METRKNVVVFDVLHWQSYFIISNCYWHLFLPLIKYPPTHGRQRYDAFTLDDQKYFASSVFSRDIYKYRFFKLIISTQNIFR